MVHIVLQVWGGLFYLLNKVLFALTESDFQQRGPVWRIRSWAVYLVGLPAWVWIFVSEHNWIAASLETAGAPSMVLGLLIALGYQKAARLKWLDRGSLVLMLLGVGYSWYDFGTLVTINQLLEIAMVTGFLVGTYLLAKQRGVGYLWFLLMNSANAVLMYREHFPWLVAQQIASLAFVGYAFYKSYRASS